MKHLDEGVLHALADGEIPSAELAPLRDHLAACAECRAQLDEARQVAGEAEALVVALGDGTEADPDGRRRTRADGGGSGAGGTRRPIRWLAWAASIVIAAGLGYAGGREIDQSILGVDPEPKASEPLREADAAASIPSDTGAAPSLAAASETTRAGRQPSDRRPTDQLAAAKPATPSPVPAEPAERELPKVGLDEIVVTSAPTAPAGGRRDERAQANRPEPPAALRAAAPLRQEEARIGLALADADDLTFDGAIRWLGGRIRLVEGLVPEGVQRLGDMVRVTYRLGESLLLLDQWAEGDSLAVRLSAEPPVDPDSLARLRARVR